MRLFAWSCVITLCILGAVAAVMPDPEPKVQVMGVQLSPHPTPTLTPPPTPVPTPIPTPAPTVAAPVIRAPSPKHQAAATVALRPVQHLSGIRAEIAAAWPGDDRWALRVTYCETGGYHDFYNERSGASGVWQFMPSTWRSLGQTGDPRSYSVTHQTQQAWRLFQRSGPGQWDCA